MAKEEKYTEVELHDGTLVQCRLVPMFAQMAVYQAHPAPKMPKVLVKTLSGKEEKDPLPESDEWGDYQAAVEKHKNLIAREIVKFSLNYAIIAWKRPDEKEYVTEPPQDWTLDPALASYIKIEDTPYEKRCAYIMYELLLTEDDLAKVEIAAGTREARPVSGQEVNAALAPFDSKPDKANRSKRKKTAP